MGDLPRGMGDFFEQANVSLSVSLDDAQDHPLLRVNDGFTRLTGYSFDQAVNRNCRFLQGPLDDQPGLARLRAFLRSDEKRVRVQVINYRADGHPFVNLLTLTRLTGPGGQTRYLLGTQFDITAAAPEDLLKYDDRLLALARPSSKMQRDILLGTSQSMAEATASIAQARLLIEEADRSGLLL